MVSKTKKVGSQSRFSSTRVVPYTREPGLGERVGVGERPVISSRNQVVRLWMQLERGFDEASCSLNCCDVQLQRTVVVRGHRSASMQYIRAWRMTSERILRRLLGGLLCTALARSMATRRHGSGQRPIAMGVGELLRNQSTVTVHCSQSQVHCKSGTLLPLDLIIVTIESVQPTPSVYAEHEARCIILSDRLTT
jgi:hypothetical protein